MALPLTRNTTYAADSKVKSVDLNDIQDEIIALWAGQHGDVVEVIAPAAAHVDANCAYSFSGRYIASTGTAQCDFPLPVRTGDRIKSFTIARYGAAASSIVFRAYKMTAGGTVSEIETAVTVNNPAAAWTDTTFDIDPDVVVAAGETFFFAVEFGATGMRVGAVRMTKDHPP